MNPKDLVIYGIAAAVFCYCIYRLGSIAQVW